MNGLTRKPTQAERVRASLADAIVRGELGPGVALDEATIAEKFQVSRTPVREAIRQLEAIGFAEARPHRGAVVPHFTPEKLNDMFTVMAEMEALCARYAADAHHRAGAEGTARPPRGLRGGDATGDVEGYYAPQHRLPRRDLPGVAQPLPGRGDAQRSATGSRRSASSSSRASGVSRIRSPSMTQSSRLSSAATARAPPP